MSDSQRKASRLRKSSSVTPPPKARVEDAEAQTRSWSARSDYLEGFLSAQPKPAEPSGRPAATCKKRSSMPH
jgi:hypothetical protein